MSRPQVEAFYLPRDEHSLFCLLFSPPPGTIRVGSILHVPAFAEEMNKSRRAVANAARALAANGWQVMLFDLHGTGDSSGEFSDASWAGWLTDIHTAYQWLQRRTSSNPTLWGLRVGCLLAGEVLDSLPAQELIYWQPVMAGETALTQMLRLRTVGSAGSTGKRKETTRTLVDALERGETLEVAGYDLPATVALPLRAAKLSVEAHASRRITWLEIALTDPPECSPASSRRIEELRARDAEVVTQAVAGVPFWTTQEIDEASALVAATAAAIGTTS